MDAAAAYGSHAGGAANEPTDDGERIGERETLLAKHAHGTSERDQEALEGVRPKSLQRRATGGEECAGKSWQWSCNPGPPGHAIRAHLGHLNIAND